MLVANSQEHVTHAVIGGGETMDFGISNNAEFFQILSSSLYTNQILAVVREVMCNAWDAHIEAGKQDTPIFVSVRNNEFIVRDFGTGIPKENIKEVYGVYGQSTKRLNGQVTGGFGLGCKSPFAYQDHFEVTSWNQGEQSIYAMCRSSADASGKPGITPIVQLPTEETGLQVKVAMKPNDLHAFIKNIKMVASNGEMKVSFLDHTLTNDAVTLPVIPYSKAKHNFTMLSWGSSFLHGVINVRYGNVIYPVPEQDPFIEDYRQVIAVINGLSGGRRNACLVLQAEPHSICVAPSREALSMQPKTVDTLRKLMTDFRNIINSTRYGEVLRQQYNLALKEAATQITTPHELWSTNFMTKLSVPEYQQSVEETARYSIVNGGSTHGRVKLIPHILNLIPQENKGAAYQLYHSLVSGGSKGEWYCENVLAKLTAFMSRFAKDLYKPKFVVTNYRLAHLNDNIRDVYFNNIREEQLVKKAVILTCSPSTVRNRLDNWPNIQSGNVFLVQGIARHNPDLDKLRKALSERKDILFLDMTVKHSWEIKEDDYVKPVKRPKGIVKISETLNGYGPKQGHDGLDESCYIQEPEFVFESSRSDSRIQYPFTSNTFTTFLKKYGHVGGITITTASTNSYLDKGAKTLVQFAIDKAYAHLINSKKIARYVSIRRASAAGTGIIDCIIENDDLAKEFGVYTEVSKEDLFFLQLLKELPYEDPKVREIKNKFNKKRPPDFFSKITEVAKRNLFLKYVNPTLFSGLLRSSREEDMEEKKQGIALLKSILTKELK